MDGSNREVAVEQFDECTAAMKGIRIINVLISLSSVWQTDRIFLFFPTLLAVSIICGAKRREHAANVPEFTCHGLESIKVYKNNKSLSSVLLFEWKVTVPVQFEPSQPSQLRHTARQKPLANKTCACADWPFLHPGSLQSAVWLRRREMATSGAVNKT